MGRGVVWGKGGEDAAGVRVWGITQRAASDTLHEVACMPYTAPGGWYINKTHIGKMRFMCAAALRERPRWRKATGG